MEKRILLIDGDLRRPRLHRLFKIDNNFGISNLNDLSETNFQKLIIEDNKLYNIDLITAGPTVKDPFKIYNSDNFEKFIIWLKTLDKYEFIIFDSPQSLFLAESNLLCSKSDFTIFIVSLFKVDRDIVNESINNLKLAGGNILGVITISRSDSDSFGYNYSNNLNVYYNSYFKGPKEKNLKQKRYSLINNFLKWFNNLL